MTRRRYPNSTPSKHRTPTPEGPDMRGTRYTHGVNHAETFAQTAGRKRA